MKEEDIFGLLTDVAQLLRDTAQDRREQANQFTALLEKQSAAIADSEVRAGNLNTMMTHVFEFLHNVKEERVALAKAIDSALECNRALSAELHKLVEMHNRQQEEIHQIRKMYDDALMKCISMAQAAGTTENKIEIKK